MPLKAMLSLMRRSLLFDASWIMDIVTPQGQNECASLLAWKHLPIFTPLNRKRLEEIYTQQFEARLDEFETGQRATKSKGWWFLKPAR